jgi:hypothetical protein
MWSAAAFRSLHTLSERVRAYVSLIDCDENNPVHVSCGRIGSEGYWVFRIGGHLSPRVTYRLCPSLPNFDDHEVKERVKRDPAFLAFTNWGDCKKRVDRAGCILVTRPARAREGSRE